MTVENIPEGLVEALERVHPIQPLTWLSWNGIFKTILAWRDENGEPYLVTKTLADAWAEAARIDELEHNEFLDARIRELEAQRDGLLAECERHRRANLVRAVFDGYGELDEQITDLIHSDQWDAIPWRVAESMKARCTALEEALRLEPAERMALTIARVQVREGREVGANTAAVCVMALDRLASLPGVKTKGTDDGD